MGLKSTLVPIAVKTTATLVYTGLKIRKALKGDKPKKSTIGNAALGYSFEKGSAAMNRPATPWLVPGVGDARDQIIKHLKVGATEGLKDKNAIEKSLNKAGLVAVSSVKNRIINQIDLPTPDRPGKKYMIDEAQLLNAITYVIEE